MRAVPISVGFLLVAAAVGQPPNQKSATGVIYGIVIGPEGNPAKGISLTACPLGVALGTILPRTRADQHGNYRFENISRWGRYTVYADDLDAGYSPFSTGSGSNRTEVDLSPEHAEAQLNLRLPPRAGFLQIYLTNKKTGAIIPELRVTLRSAEEPGKLLFSESCSSSQAILLPRDKDLLLHVTSSGFREWDETSGRGKRIRARSGSQLKIGVVLEPSD
jgi:hypothetical protein